MLKKNFDKLIEEATEQYKKNNLDQVSIVLNEIFKIDQNQSFALLLEGLLFSKKKKYIEAVNYFDRAITSKKDYLEAWFNKGLALLELKRFEESLSCFDQAIQLKPDFVDAWFNKGGILLRLKRFDEAISHFKKTTELKPDFEIAWSNKGYIYKEQGCFEESLACFDQAIRINPENPIAWSNKGNILTSLKRYSEAVDHYNKAIKLNPEYAIAWCNKGNLLSDLKQYDDALAHFDKAIQLKKDYSLAYFSKGCVKLRLGDFYEGWNLYEYRWAAQTYRYNEYPSLTSINNIENKKILVWHEQGMGDVLQFSRFISELIKLKANIFFEVQKDLVNLLKGQFSCLVTSKIRRDIKFDFQVPLLTLPKLFKINLNNIPQINKFKIDHENMIHYEKKLKLSASKLNIGIAISGDKRNVLNLKRSMPLRYISPLLKYGNFFLIQKDINQNDLIFLNENKKIFFTNKEINNFSDTAAIVANMDLVISIDTSLIHLAGSLHKKAFLILNFSADWRWLVNRTDTPWYPTIKIFRQKQINNWETVINEIEKDLEKFKKNRSGKLQ